jgi:hypothetical protein
LFPTYAAAGGIPHHVASTVNELTHARRKRRSAMGECTKSRGKPELRCAKVKKVLTNAWAKLARVLSLIVDTMTLPSALNSKASLEEIGLYNVLTSIAQGQGNVEPFLLATLREKGLVTLDDVALTVVGVQTLKALTIRLGWFYPETEPSESGSLTDAFC